MEVFGIHLHSINWGDKEAYRLGDGKYVVVCTGKGGDDAFELYHYDMEDEPQWVDVCRRATLKCAVAKYKLINHLPPYN